MNENELITDHEDRLIDRALHESLGDDAPPDLAERILAAASKSHATTTIADTSSPVSRRWHWAMFAVAASLFVAAGFTTLNRLQDDLGNAQLASSKRELKEAQESTAGQPAPALTGDEANGNSSLGDLINERYPAFQDDDSVRGLAVEEASVPQVAEAAPQAAEGRRLEEVEFEASGGAGEATIRPSSSGRSMRFRIDAAPGTKGSTVDAHGNLERFSEPILADRKVLAPTPAASPAADFAIDGGGGGLGGGGGRFGGGVPLPVLPSVESFAVVPEKLERARAMGGPVDMARHAAITRELQEKADQFQKLHSRLDAGSNPESERLEAEIEQLQEATRQLEQQMGRGPGNSGDQYTRIYENPFVEAKLDKAVSTFSIDVDTASYANVRQFLLQSNQLPPPDAVRIEELVNYFDYDYSGPTGDVPFAAHVEVAGCPWQPEHRLVRVGIKGREMERAKRPQSNLVFLVDVSGSMDEPNKLPLLIEGMKQFTRELGENDRVAIVVYASSEGLALASTRGDQQSTILAALEQLRAGGSTAGGAGIELAYQTAQDNFIQGGVNRVILCTDGDFNVGVTSTADLERLAEQKAKDTGVFLTVLGFGRGNLNDAMMEAISGKGNGNYHYIDSLTEARKVLVEEMAGTLVTIAKDVKIQIEFNPAQVAGYRLIGYENRMLRTEDFKDDKKDAGEIGAGHTVTALYEIVPTGKPVNAAGVDPLKYQDAPAPVTESIPNKELLTLKLRHKQPDGNVSSELQFPITDQGGSFAEATEDFQFAAAVASFGMLLRDSEHRGNATYASILEIASAATERDPQGYRAEFLRLVHQAKQLSGQ